MALSKEERRLLGVSTTQSRILRSLDKQADGISIQALAKIAALPRTTLYWPLKQLERRNLIAFEYAGKRKRWFSRLSELPLRKKIGSLQSVAGDVHVVEGVEQIRKLYNLALDLHPSERLLILEGIAAAKSIRKKGGLPFISAWHVRAQRQRIILESILGEKTLNTSAQIDSRVLKSLSRLTLWIGYTVPDKWIDVDSTILLFRDAAVIADWKEERAVYINTPEIVRLIRNFCEVYKIVGKKVDIVSHIRTSLREAA